MHTDQVKHSLDKQNNSKIVSQMTSLDRSHSFIQSSNKSFWNVFDDWYLLPRLIHLSHVQQRHLIENLCGNQNTLNAFFSLVKSAKPKRETKKQKFFNTADMEQETRQEVTKCGDNDVGPIEQCVFSPSK